MACLEQKPKAPKAVDYNRVLWCVMSYFCKLIFLPHCLFFPKLPTQWCFMYLVFFIHNSAKNHC